MLAVAFAFVMLGFGGAGGIINMSYQLDETVHNTQWITGHFHLIFAGAIVSMYFVLAYDLWPQLLRRGPLPAGPIKWQLWLWFVGMMITTLPWHWVGLLGMPRRMAYFDYSHPLLQPQAITVTISSVGGLMLLVSGLLFIWILASAHRRAGDTAVPLYTFARPVHVAPVPAALNGFRLWVGLMIALTVVNYGFPIAQLASLPQTSVPVVRVGGPR
jgi:cytochrome c oxidase subunit 1